MENKTTGQSLILIIFLVALNFAVWFQIAFGKQNSHPKISFLDIGQGDSTLIQMPGNVKILVDAGPSSRVINQIEKILGSSDKYIDLAVITHPQLDHFNGFNYLLDRYNFGAFIVNGRQTDIPEWTELLAKLAENKIPKLVLAAGDRVNHGKDLFEFLSPSQDLIQSAELNDTSFVNLLNSEGVRLLLTGDIGGNVEKYLINNLPAKKLEAQILKVGHHGSKYSTSKEFLASIEPKIAIIEVGDNRFGHPTKETLERLENSGILKILRTDLDGLITARLKNGNLIFTLQN